MPTSIKRSIPSHISNFKFLTENQPDISSEDRNGDPETTDYMADFGRISRADLRQ
jgi:hypothetical protein